MALKPETESADYYADKLHLQIARDVLQRKPVTRKLKPLFEALVFEIDQALMPPHAEILDRQADAERELEQYEELYGELETALTKLHEIMGRAEKHVCPATWRVLEACRRSKEEVRVEIALLKEVHNL